jgi:hypothetical protein
MPSFQWARLNAPVKCTLRLGAWYRILKLTASEAVVDVQGSPVSVPREQLQLAPKPGVRWTVVPAPQDAPTYPPNWGPKYAVCPNCRDRAQIAGHPVSMRCGRCNGLFEIAWNEGYLTPA